MDSAKLLAIQWAAFRPNGDMIRWIGARRTKKEVIARAVEGCMGCREYEELGNDSDRWNHCYRRGYRIKRVAVLPLAGEVGK